MVSASSKIIGICENCGIIKVQVIISNLLSRNVLPFTGFVSTVEKTKIFKLVAVETRNGTRLQLFVIIAGKTDKRTIIWEIANLLEVKVTIYKQCHQLIRKAQKVLTG